MRLALLGDIHAWRLYVPPWRLLNKRLLGQMNLWLRRRRMFDVRLLRPALERIKALQVEMLLLSGDLTATSLEGEFMDMARELAAVRHQIPTLIVPGNHDRYTGAAVRQRTMEKCLGDLVPPRFPYFCRLAGTWHLLALDGVWPHFFSANGRLGQEQLTQAEEYLRSLSQRDGLVVLCHYPLAIPPDVPRQRGHRLKDGAELQRLLASCQARQLYLHGHVHRPWVHQPQAPALAHVLDINAGAPTMRLAGHPMGQGFWQIDLPEDPYGEVRLLRHTPTADRAKTVCVSIKHWRNQLPQAEDWAVEDVL